MKPVYVINGFLDSGKSSFFAYTLGQPYFRTKGTTLLITCEEGMVGYGPKLLAATNTVHEEIVNEADFTPSTLMALETKYDPERILIEWNGMWNFRNFKLPKKWMLEQQMTTIDAQTLPMYLANGDLMSFLTEEIRDTELIMINRCDGVDKKQLISYKRKLKAVNPEAALIFEDKNGEVDTAEAEDLPYDMHADPIVLEGLDYAIWFQDVMEHPDWYEGRSVSFAAQVLRSGMPEGTFLAGRPIMGCCANDIRVFGYPCRCGASLQDGEWLRITARVSTGELQGLRSRRMHLGYYDAVPGEGIILETEEFSRISAPAEPVLDFTAPQ